MLATLVLALTAATALSLIRERWPTELLSHFRPHLVLAAIVLGVAAVAVQDFAAAAMGLGLALLNWALLPERKWLKPDSADRPGLTIVWANVWKRRGALDRTLKWAEEQKADLILLGEFPNANPADPALAPAYPHRLDGLPGGTPNNRCSRVVALSRLPLLDAQVIPQPSGHVRPFLSFALDVEGQGRINIYAIHPNAPVFPGRYRDRETMIAKLAETAKPPFLIAGDFNATPWCMVYSKIPGQRIGALTPTWITTLSLIGLAIDHIMVSAGVKPNLYRVGPFLGSDHRALLARIHGFGDKAA